MSAVMPATLPVERTRTFQDEWAVRYGVLMGGTKIIKLDGIGQFFVGHHEIPRRQLIGFTSQEVRGRNEDESILDDPSGSLLGPGPLDQKKLTLKSPALCMREMIQMYGAQGFVNSQTLMGDQTNADRLFNVVLPSEIAELPVVDVIGFLQDSTYVEKAFMDRTLMSRAQQLREECLQGAFISRDYMTMYTNAISEEIGSEKKTGKKKVDSVDIQYYWELKKTLPEDRPLEATTRLGKEIATAMSGTGGTDALVVEMREQNRLKAEENELRRFELSQAAPTETKRGSAKRPAPETDKGE